ncbi:MAG: SCP2 sterol-binding domain-containing protein [Gammaproteobacteria bacterium]
MQPMLTFSAALETALNLWLKNDDRSVQRLHALQGKVVELHIREFPGSLFFYPGSSGIQILTRYEGTADATISSSIAGLLHSKFQNPEDALFSGGIKINGDTELGEQFQSLLSDVDFDWQEHLSKVTGDVMAHQVGKAVQHALRFASQTTATIGLDITEYLQEEARLIPARVEIEHYLKQIDDLRSHSDRLDARVQRLKHALDSAQ